MKKLLNIFAVIALFAGFTGCSGSGSDAPEVEGGNLTLEGDKSSILANGADKVVFTVKLGNTDVTDKAKLYLVERDGDKVSEKLSSALFGSRQEGTYIFEARYGNRDDEKTSNRVTVKVSGKEVNEVFYRKIFAQYLTSVGCHNCPRMMQAVKSLDQKYKDRLVIAAFHTDFSQVTDPMTTPLTMDYMIKILFHQGLPGFFLDVRSGTNCYGLTTEKTTIANIESTLTEYPAACGVKIDSKYDATKKTVNVKFTVKATVTNEYRILPFIVEDEIVGFQADGSLYGAASDYEYVHNNVVRASLATQLIGDRLNTIEKDAEATKSYSFDIKEGWNPDKMRIVVCVLDTANGVDFIGNNAATCGINESIDYAYNE